MIITIATEPNNIPRVNPAVNKAHANPILSLLVTSARGAPHTTHSDRSTDEIPCFTCDMVGFNKLTHGTVPK